MKLGEKHVRRPEQVWRQGEMCQELLKINYSDYSY